TTSGMPARGISGRARKIPSSAATEGDSSPYLRRFGLGFLGVCTSTRRVTVAPLLPPGETLVSCKRFEALFVRSELKSCLGKTKRTSLLPLRRDAVPRLIEPSSVCSFPSPLEKTARRRSRVLAETRRSSGA